MVIVTQTTQFARKVILNSDLKTSSVNTAAQFKLREGVSFERNYIGVVNVESASLQTPSILHSETLAASNQFIVDGVNYWESGMYSTGGLKEVFLACENWDLTNAMNVLTLYVNLLEDLPVGSLKFHITGTNAMVTLESATQATATTLRASYQGDENGIFNTTAVEVSGDVVAGETVILAYITEQNEQIGTPNTEPYLLKKLSDTVFYHDSLVSRISNILEAAKEYKVIFDAVSSIKITGPILKFFGWYDESGVEIAANTAKIAVLQNKGYDFLNIHTNLGRSVMNGDKNDNQIKRGNILWTLPMTSLPSETLLFTNYNNGGKLPYQDEMVEEIYIYFTDIWGDRVPVSKFSMVLLFDAHEIETATPGPTIKRARTQMLEALKM